MFPQLRELLLVLSTAAIVVERRGDRMQHVLIAKRLGQKIDRAGFHGLDGHGYIAVAGHEYDRNRIFALASSAWKSSPLTAGNRTSSTRQLATSGRLLRKKSAAEPNVSTLSRIERNKFLS